MNFKYLFIVLAAGIWVALLPEDAYAWGAGVHIMQVSFILDNLHLISPTIAEVIRKQPNDYLYGAISVDIFAGQGYKRRPNHCHNWAAGFKLLEKSKTKSDLAFSYGYLSHLCGDVVSHNVYVPNQLFLSNHLRRMGHVYWEVRSDWFTPREYWNKGLEVIDNHHEHDDVLVQAILPRKYFPFESRKKLLRRTIRSRDLMIWRKAVSIVTDRAKLNVSSSYINYLNQVSQYLIVDILQDPERAVALRYDPIGTDRMIASKKVKRYVKRKYQEKPQGLIFEIPEDILGLLPEDQICAIA